MNAFTVIDFETANAQRSSPCSVAAVKVEDGQIVDTFATLIDPEQEFGEYQVRVHGITAEAVEGAPTFDLVNEMLADFIGKGGIMVSHSKFDDSVIRKTCEEQGLEPPHYIHIDSIAVLKNAWPEKYAKDGADLKTASNDWGIKLDHHNALSDAKAAAELTIRALAHTGTEIGEWVERQHDYVDPTLDVELETKAGARAASAEGKFNGEKIVFTGELQMPRSRAQDMAAAAGLRVTTSVSKKTSFVVVGEDAGSKKAKAESLGIPVLNEAEFLAMVSA